jgi:hypothetical protein
MVRAVLRDLIVSPDPRTLPGDPAGFAFGVQLLVGPADGPGEESFELTACSPEWLAVRCGPGDFALLMIRVDPRVRGRPQLQTAAGRMWRAGGGGRVQRG